jgi:predicted nicotinamide N-methyase
VPLAILERILPGMGTRLVLRTEQAASFDGANGRVCPQRIDSRCKTGGQCRVTHFSLDECIEFVRARTSPAPVPLVPEIVTRQATELTPLWKASAAGPDTPVPFWAFPWAGGQALARYLLDHADLVRGRRVFDFGSGSGLVAIAAMRAGAASVTASDLDLFCQAATGLNAALSGVAVEFLTADLLGDPLDGVDVVLAGDIFYEQPLADASMRWLRSLAARGVHVLVGDPGRLYSPQCSVVDRAAYDVPTSTEIEARPVMRTWVLEVVP